MHTFQSVNIILELPKAELDKATWMHDNPISCLYQPLATARPSFFLLFLLMLPDYHPASSTSLFVLVSSPASPMEFPLPALLPLAQGMSQFLMMCVFSSSPFPKDLIFIPFVQRD